MLIFFYYLWIFCVYSQQLELDVLLIFPKCLLYLVEFTKSHWMFVNFLTMRLNKT